MEIGKAPSSVGRVLIFLKDLPLTNKIYHVAIFYNRHNCLFDGLYDLISILRYHSTEYVNILQK